MVEEPSPGEALRWLQGLRGRYEAHHGVRYTEAALETGGWGGREVGRANCCESFAGSRRIGDRTPDCLPATRRPD